jgi:hypothetical protein
VPLSLNLVLCGKSQLRHRHSLHPGKKKEKKGVQVLGPEMTNTVASSLFHVQVGSGEMMYEKVQGIRFLFLDKWADELREGNSHKDTIIRTRRCWA